MFSICHCSQEVVTSGNARRSCPGSHVGAGLSCWVTRRSGVRQKCHIDHAFAVSWCRSAAIGIESVGDTCCAGCESADIALVTTGSGSIGAWPSDGRLGKRSWASLGKAKGRCAQDPPDAKVGFGQDPWFVTTSLLGTGNDSESCCPMTNESREELGRNESCLSDLSW
jgi:hypothetical protein